MTPVTATVGHGTTALWYLTRATGLVALGSVVDRRDWRHLLCRMGQRPAAARSPFPIRPSRRVAPVPRPDRGGRGAYDGGRRDVPISLLDAVIPFRTPWTTAGWHRCRAHSTCSWPLRSRAQFSSTHRGQGVADRPRAGLRMLANRPFHALVSGSDARLPVAQFVYLACVVSVIAALGRRIAAGEDRHAPGGGSAAAVRGSLVLFGAAVFAFTVRCGRGGPGGGGTVEGPLAALSPVGAGRGPPHRDRWPARRRLPETPFTYRGHRLLRRRRAGRSLATRRWSSRCGSATANSCYCCCTALLFAVASP